MFIQPLTDCMDNYNSNGNAMHNENLIQDTNEDPNTPPYDECIVHKVKFPTFIYLLCLNLTTSKHKM